MRAFDSRFGRGAILICEDLWHPSTAYIAALDGALTSLCPSASPLGACRARRASRTTTPRYWELLNARLRAESFGMFLVYANRVGFEDGVGFWGGSEILDAARRARWRKARYYEPDLIVAEIDLAAVARGKRIAAPLLRDEDLDLTINELVRIRGRATRLDAKGEVAVLEPVAGRARRAKR